MQVKLQQCCAVDVKHIKYAACSLQINDEHVSFHSVLVHCRFF